MQTYHIFLSLKTCLISSRYSCLSSDWDAWMMMDPRHKMEDYHMENWWTKWRFPKLQLTTCKYKLLLDSQSKPAYIQNTIFVTMELGMDCCRRSTNRNILSLGGRNPNLSAVITTTNPMGCTKNSLVNVIAIVDRTPKCELPDPAIQFSNFSCLRPNSVVA